MKKLFLLPIALLGFATAGALASNGSKTSSTAGRITAVHAASVTVKGMTCKRGATSPHLDAFKVGTRVRIVCAKGVLSGIARLSATKQGDEPTSTVTTATAAGGYGTITKISTAGTGSITAVGRITLPTSTSASGDTSVTCALGPASPAIGGFHVGDYVRIRCADGVLTTLYLAATSTTTTTATTPTTTTTTGTTTTVSVSKGAITALSGNSISVYGDRGTTCSIGPESPSLVGYALGDSVQMGCTNGVLRTIGKL